MNSMHSPSKIKTK